MSLFYPFFNLRNLSYLIGKTKLADFVYRQDYTVLELKGDRAVIGKGKVVTAAVKLGDLTRA